MPSTQGCADSGYWHTLINTPSSALWILGTNSLATSLEGCADSKTASIGINGRYV
jgi:hypothetical protein